MSNNPSGPSLCSRIPGCTYILTTLRQLAGWSKKYSLWSFSAGMSCCALEMANAFTFHADIEQFGVTEGSSPCQADLLIITGTVSKKMAPHIKKQYLQMPSPRYVLAVGACAISGGPFRSSYALHTDIRDLVPVDVFCPGCPPHPASFVQAIRTLQSVIGSAAVKG